MKRFLGGLVLTTFLALTYVQQRVVLITEGYRVEALRHQKEDLLDQHRVLQYNVLTLRSPAILSQRLAHRDVQLTPPQQVEVLRSVVKSTPIVQPQVGQMPTQPNMLRQAGKLAARWLENGRQAEAEPAL